MTGTNDLSWSPRLLYVALLEDEPRQAFYAADLSVFSVDFAP